LQLDGILVEAMARPGIELVLGMRNDADWGPVLVIGLGGVWTEALGDVRVLPADLLPAAIAGELRRLKAAPLLTGFRGAPALDVEVVAEIASRLGRFAADHPEIAELDINPLIVYPRQQGAVAVDALMIVR
jgi:acyl-CoA synthetase (NDP forming)